MEKEPHNFIANNFISHNSHSLSYGAFAIQMMYLKCYYRKYFNLAVLNNEETDEKKGMPKIKKTMEDCESRGWMKPFNLNEISYCFQLDKNGKIIPGVRILKGVGEKNIEEIIKNKPYNNIPDFLTRSKCNKLVLKALNDANFFVNTFGKPLDTKMLENKNKSKKVENKSGRLF
jgi:DNA polymerase III alpha subunit